MGTVSRAAWQLRWSVQQRGLGGTVRSALAAVQRRLRPAEPERVHPFDVLYGTDTGGLIAGGALAVGSANDAHITGYAGTAPSRFRDGMERWQRCLEPEETLAEFAFVDLGCGKGRAVLMASALPFREAVGVELNGALAETGQQNLARWQAEGRAVCPARVLQGDATAFAWPDGPCLVFIYNAFTGPVMAEVLRRLAARGGGHANRFDLMFLNEPEDGPLRTDSRLRLLWRGSLALSAEDAAADPVASPGDVTSLYRWVG